MIRTAFYTACFGVMLASMGCNNDVQISAPYQDIPVVYCILNPADTVHYLRLEKSFNGEASALEMAQEPDSIYYPDAQVILERWEDGDKQQEWFMLPVTVTPREAGLFVSDPNRLYSLNANLEPDQEYRLQVEIPSTQKTVTAQTHLVSNFRIIKPEYYRKSLPFSSYDNYTLVEWVTAKHTRVYHLSVRFHYLEVDGLDTTFQTAVWNIANFAAEHDAGGITMDHSLLHRNFYKWLGNKLPPSLKKHPAVGS